MRTLLLLLLFGLISNDPIALSQPTSNHLSLSPRAEFATRMAKIRHGMDAEQVRNLLGNPDYITPPENPNPFVMEIWKYGADRGDALPTLGRVYFDSSGKVIDIAGEKGTSPAPDLVEETRLRSLLQIIHRSPGCQGLNFNPLTLIQAVNALQPLGKQKALAIIREYWRVAAQNTEQDRLFLLLRVLFDVPEVGYAPPLWLGKSDLPTPLDPKLVPCFPLVIVEDIPLMLVDGYDCEGHPGNSIRHIEYYEQHGKLRAKPLAPTSRPLQALTKLEATKQWLYGRPYTPLHPRTFQSPDRQADGRRLLGAQLLRLIGSIYYLSEDRVRGLYTDLWWNQARKETAALNIQWNPAKNDFEIGKKP